MRAPYLLLPLLVGFAVVAAPATPSAQVSIGISIRIAPPVLPVYVQPEIPGPGYIWSPGYWAWGDDDYYWVPGTWVEAPEPGLLWTPGYWDCGDDGVYFFHTGYWGPRVGFYGGINYGFGYTGVGFLGGRWEGGVFAYNTAVTNVGSTHITNVYNQTVINNTTVVNNNVSFNGKGGITAKPTPQELAAAQERHVAPTTLQTQHQQAASTNRALFASVNHGAPAVAASPKAGVFSGRGVVGAKAVTLSTGGKGTPGTGQSPVGSKGTAATNFVTGAKGTGGAAAKGTGGAAKGTGSTVNAATVGTQNVFRPATPKPPPRVTAATVSAPKPPPPPPPRVNNAARFAAPKPPPKPPAQPGKKPQ
jgi:hypothetical protein